MKLTASSCLVLIGVGLVARQAAAFAPLRPPTTPSSSSRLQALLAPPAMEALPFVATVPLQQLHSAAQVSQFASDPSASSSQLYQGVQQFVVASSSKPSPLLLESSSLSLSLQERHIPTAEEIAQKKLNFNLWFWGGGFVAPFLATIFYFGPKFWTK